LNARHLALEEQGLKNCAEAAAQSRVGGSR
jgi:hypothetical protein